MQQPAYQTFDDETLIRLIALARSEALGALYDRYGRLAFSIALRSVGDPGTAEEVTQDVFLRVWEHAGEYRSERAQVSTWLTSIARHRAIDRLRRRRARPESNSVALADVAPFIEAAGIGPEQTAALALDRARVRSALGRLAEEQQQVLLLAYFGGQTQREMAKTLNLPLGTVKTRVRLGMQHLRAILEAEPSRQ